MTGSRRALIGLLALAGVWLLVRSWAADDAFITWRVHENLLAGRGLRWSPDERVMVYTHPLWMLLQIPTYAALRLARVGLYTGPWAALVLAVPASLATLWLLGRRQPWPHALLVPGTLLLSRTWVDFSVSGLEVPLTGLLVVYFALSLPPPGAAPRWGLLSVLAALGVLTRPDAALVFAPALLWVARRDGVRWRPVLLGALPLLVWFVFASAYYGTPVPNPAFAKLLGGVPRADLLVQGLAYAGVSALFDPAAVVLVALAGWAAWRARRSDPRALLLVAGAALMALWVVWIGGDFMAGRFFAPSVCAAAAALSLAPARPGLPSGALAMAALAALSFGSRLAVPPRPWVGVMDERHAHMGTRSLLHPVHFFWQGRRLRHSRAAQAFECDDQPSPPFVDVVQAAGLRGYTAPHRCVVVVDALGVTDPLLARLPADLSEGWRPGHLRRDLPEGYRQVLVYDPHWHRPVEIDDPAIRACYADITLLSRAPLFEPARLGAALRVGFSGCP